MRVRYAIVAACAVITLKAGAAPAVADAQAGRAAQAGDCLEERRSTATLSTISCSFTSTCVPPGPVVFSLLPVRVTLAH